VAVRMNCFTGETQRIISSTAVGTSSGSSRKRWSWSGCSISACIPPAIAELVVSCPAVAMIT
jgi:hypothetical protein